MLSQIFEIKINISLTTQNSCMEKLRKSYEILETYVILTYSIKYGFIENFIERIFIKIFRSFLLEKNSHGMCNIISYITQK